MLNQVNLDRVKSAVNFLRNFTELNVPNNQQQQKVLVSAIREASLIVMQESNDLWGIVYEADQ